jgi:hypothetical protein
MNSARSGRGRTTQPCLANNPIVAGLRTVVLRNKRTKRQIPVGEEFTSVPATKRPPPCRKLDIAKTARQGIAATARTAVALAIVMELPNKIVSRRMNRRGEGKTRDANAEPTAAS